MIGTAWNAVWPYLVAVAVFLVLIVIHEFGHFIAAKLLGVRVNEFSVGFGPKIFKKQWGETRYCVGIVPFGGYCAMEGEEEDSTDEKAFCRKKPWRRFLIVIMGATFNLLFGLLLIAVILAPQKRFASTVVAEFAENSVSSQYGLQVDDKIVGVDGRRIFTNYDLGYAFSNVKDGKVDLTVVRDGKKVLLRDVHFATEEVDGITFLSVDFYIYGIQKTLVNYVKQTGRTALSYAVVIWRSLIDLLSGKYGISAVSGPVGITASIGTVAKNNLWDLLPILALISINLGIFNLLPIPALDGGRLLFILIEMIFRKPVPQKYESLVHGIGFAILLTLMALITAKDIWKLFA
ncbi:MAG: site-2 protease family protein [Clostridia bacterium]|nr:site-2 protease family protein [Clostridia bacterium]